MTDWEKCILADYNAQINKESISEICCETWRFATGAVLDYCILGMGVFLVTDRYVLDIAGVKISLYTWQLSSAIFPIVGTALAGSPLPWGLADDAEAPYQRSAVPP